MNYHERLQPTQSGRNFVISDDAYHNKICRHLHWAVNLPCTDVGHLFLPQCPSTPSGWLWAFLPAIPLQLAFEFLGELVSKNKATRFVAQKTAEQSFSLVRILYGVVLFLVFAGLVIGAGYGWHMFRQ